MKLNSPDMSIFIGDLPSNITDIMLFNFYSSRYRSCISAKIMVDPVSRISKGYGFVKFGIPYEAERAIIETNGMNFYGRIIRVSTAQKKDIATHDTGVKIVSFNGFGYDITIDDVTESFRKFGEIVSVNIQHSKGFGSVEFKRKEDAEKCSSYSNMKIKNYIVNIGLGKPIITQPVNTNNMVQSYHINYIPQYISSPVTPPHYIEQPYYQSINEMYDSPNRVLSEPISPKIQSYNDSIYSVSDGYGISPEPDSNSYNIYQQADYSQADYSQTDHTPLYKRRGKMVNLV